jgi:Na+-transporting methylmalonyl-CoA/oxaloacetate decarboxylase gamma subunit
MSVMIGGVGIVFSQLLLLLLLRTSPPIKVQSAKVANFPCSTI